MDFKVKCVNVKKYPEYFTVGKIYNVKDGKCVCDNDWEFEAWAYEMNGNADFEAFSKWFEKWYEFELVKDKFTANDLETGMFGVMNTGEKFVVVNDIIVYQDDGFDKVSTFKNDLKSEFHSIEKVYAGLTSFRMLDRVINRGASYGTLVYERKAPLYNGKVVCIENSPGNAHLYTVCKIYEFVDGSFVSDNGEEIKSWYHEIASFDEWVSYSGSKWIEIKE